MAELNTACCTPTAQETCCESSEKASCCAETHDAGCGCSAGSADGATLAASATVKQVRETVRDRYSVAARAAARGDFAQAQALESESGCCGSGSASCSPADETGVFGATLYDEASREQVPEAAVGASLGCGVPTAVADPHEGETVLDLGSGAGADVLISARRVGPTGEAIGLDMTDVMLELVRANAAEAGVENVEFLKGYIEDMPLPDASVDVVMSNCVINLSGDKPQVIREAARVLAPGGRFAVSDVIADPAMDEQICADMAAWTGCIAGALTETAFRTALESAGFQDIEIRETHRVHEHAAAAIVRARGSAGTGELCPGDVDLLAATQPHTRIRTHARRGLAGDRVQQCRASPPFRTQFAVADAGSPYVRFRRSLATSTRSSVP
jgi:arsenite methyltransferase